MKADEELGGLVEPTCRLVKATLRRLAVMEGMASKSCFDAVVDLRERLNRDERGMVDLLLLEERPWGTFQNRQFSTELLSNEPCYHLSHE